MLMPLVPGALMATAALNVPGLDTSDTGFTVTCKFPGRLPAGGVTLSQDPPLLVIAVALKFDTLEAELASATVCEAAAVAPGAKTKLSELGVAEIGLVTPFPLAFRVTGMDCVVVPDVMLINPTSTPDAGALAPTDTVRRSGVEPDCGVTASQLVDERAVMETFAVPVVVESRMVCAGVVTPVCVLNVSSCGVATTVFCASAVFRQHSAAVISPSGNNTVPVLFTTYSS